MSSISGISSNAWSNVSTMRSSRPPGPPGGMDPSKLFAKVDSDSNGSVDKTELQSLLDDVAAKTGVSSSTSTNELFSTIDSNGDGSLSQDELGEGMKNIMPSPPSTLDFAQSRNSTEGSDDLFSKVDSDGNGSISQDELQTLLEKMGSDRQASGTSSTSSSSDTFSQLDSDGDGSLSQTEFEAGRPPRGQEAQGMQQAGGTPPPPQGAAKSSSYDPLDTNEDGVVSAAERAAAASSTDSSDAVENLLKAIDTDGDQQISRSESTAFIESLTSQYQNGKTQGNTDFSQLLKQAYGIAGGLLTSSLGSSLSALA